MKLHLPLFVLFGLLVAEVRCDGEVSSAEEEGDDQEPMPMEDAEEGGEGGEEPAEDDEHTDFVESEDHEGEEEENQDDDEEADEDAREDLSEEEMKELFKLIDLNGNGKVSLAELTEYAHKTRQAMAKFELETTMKEKDKDKDGKMSFDEFLGDAGAVAEKRQSEMQTEFKELDIDGDKFLNLDELASLFHHHINDKVEKTLAESAFKDRDENKDGKVSLQEFFAHLQMEGEDPVEIEEEDKDTFKKLDLDGDGFLSVHELKAWESGEYQTDSALKKIFAHADQDKDNQVTEKEWTTAHESIHDDEDGDPHMYLQMWHDHHNPGRHNGDDQEL